MLMLLVIVLFALGAASCGGDADSQPKEGAAEQPAKESEGGGNVPTADWVADGQVSEGEYANQSTIGDVTVHWRNDAEYLYIAFAGDTEGWVSVGLDPEQRMQGANYLLGAVTDGEAQIWDAYGQGPVGPTHPPDTEIGGTDDIVAYAGLEEEGTTLFEVQIPLDSGDEYDKPLEPGRTYPIIVAVGSSDEYNASHTARAAGEITLEPAQ
jgi:hypothetical protein